MTMRNAIATPKPAVTLSSTDECASVESMVIPKYITQELRTLPRGLRAPWTSRERSGRHRQETFHARTEKTFRKNRTRVGPDLELIPIKEWALTVDISILPVYTTPLLMRGKLIHTKV